MTKPAVEDQKSANLSLLSLEPSIKPAIPYDRQHQLIDVLCSCEFSGSNDLNLLHLEDMVCHLLGLLGHVIAKVQLLTVTRKLMERVGELDEGDWLCIHFSLLLANRISLHLGLRRPRTRICQAWASREGELGLQ